MAKADLTAARARELLHYDPETGLLTRKVRTSQSVRVGDVAGCKHPTKGYISLYVDGVRYKAHRVAWLIVHGKWPEGQIDHINGVPDDNRLCNLRDVSNSVNGQNKRRPKIGNTSGLLGVSWTAKSKKWRAQIQISGKVLYLGHFDDKLVAHDAYLKAKRELHEGCTI